MEERGSLPPTAENGLEVKVCVYGKHKFVSRDKFATCERCRLLRKWRRIQKKKREHKDIKKWIIEDEEDLDQLLKKFETDSGYKYVLRCRKQIGAEGFYRVYKCPRWSKSKLPPKTRDDDVSRQEKSVQAEQRRLSIHPNNRYWADKEIVGIGCPFSMIIKKSDNEPILTRITKDHCENCSPLKETCNLVDHPVYQWVANLLRLGHSAAQIFEWVSTPPLSGIEPCPEPPQDATITYVWEPSYKNIKAVEYKLNRLKRQSYLHSDARSSVCNLLQEWSGLSSGMEGHDVQTIQDHHVVYWQDFECYCPPNKNSGYKYCSRSTPRCRPFFLVLQSSWQREFMAREISAGRGHILGLDANDQVTSTQWMLQALVMIDSHDTGIPVGFALGSEEADSEAVTMFLNAISKTAPLGYCPKIVMVNNYASEIKGITESTWGSATAIRICYFRILQTWLHWLTKSVNNVPKDDNKKRVLEFIRCIKHSSSPTEANELWQRMAQYLHEENLSHVATYFYNEFIAKMTPIGPIATLWLNSVRKSVCLNGLSAECSHHCERFFNTLKCQFLENKVSKRVEHLVRVLVEKVGPFYANKSTANSSYIPKVVRSRGREKSALGIVQNEWITVLDPIMGIGSIRSSANEALHYHVGLKPPFCTCLNTDGILCKHVRALGRVLGGLDQWGIHMFDTLHNSLVLRGVPQPSLMGAGGSVELVHVDPVPNPPFMQKAVACASSVGISPAGVASVDAKHVHGTGPDLELCAAWHMLCSDRSITPEILHDMLRMISRTKQQSEHSRMDIIIAGEELLCRSAKGTQAAATLNAFQKMVWDTLNSQELVGKNMSNKWKAIESPCQPESQVEAVVVRKAD